MSFPAATSAPCRGVHGRIIGNYCDRIFYRVQIFQDNDPGLLHPAAPPGRTHRRRDDADPIFGDRAGQFLAAPRRTGKSTFLRRDLVPLLRARGLHTIYVDLWSDRAADPGLLIADALAADLRQLATLGEGSGSAALLADLGGRHLGEA
jgi:hypothetical protein